MKKVFRLWKLVEYSIKVDTDGYDALITALKLGWPQKLDGRTREEMNSLGYVCNLNWLVVEE